MTLLEFFTHNSGELGELVLEHLFLVVVSTGIAVLIGVPLGILLTRKPGLSKPILGFANIMQTVPSLALFGFLIPLNLYLFNVKIVGGIGARTVHKHLQRIYEKLGVETRTAAVLRAYPR